VVGNGCSGIYPNVLLLRRAQFPPCRMPGMSSGKGSSGEKIRIHDVLAAGVLGLSRLLMRLVTQRRQAAFVSGLAKWQPMGYGDSGLVQRVAGSGEEKRARGWRKEPDTVAWIESSVKEGDVFYDIGANVGSYSLIAHAVGKRKIKVVSFEPNPPTYASLVVNQVQNGVDGLALPLALADFRGTVRLEGDLMVSGSTSTTHEGVGVPVLCERLDDLVAERGLPLPTHIKMDVDGAEMGVLRGAVRSLEHSGLRSVLIEMDKEGELAEDIHAFMRARGFEAASSAPRLGGKLVNAIFVRKVSAVSSSEFSTSGTKP
jgi:FkbM family methyltransferase